jgi:hypothetical protein
MAKTVMILGPSGDGKSTAIIINPDGKYFEDPKWKEENLTYQGLDPETTVLFNCDGKDYPFPAERIGWKEGTNLFTSTYDKPLSAETIEKWCDKINSGTKIKTIIIDTINGSMNDKEMLETRKLTYDKWYDFAKDYYRLCVKANSYRKDLVIYMFGHIVVKDDGNRGLVTNGRKLEKIELESKVSVVLFTHVENGADGDNTFSFETQKARSSAKSAIGIFDKFLIPNSLKLVDDKIRTYYGI